MRSLFSAWKIITLTVYFISVTGLTGCTHKSRVAPIQLPEGAANMVALESGLKISARSYTDRKLAEKSFGFDIRKAGILPVQVTFQNDSNRTVTIQPGQTFLIDERNQAWPILSLDETYERTKGHVEVGETFKGAAVPSLLMGAAGAVAGAAIGIVTGNNVGEAMGKGAAVGAAAGAITGGAKSYEQTGRKIRKDLVKKRLGNEPIEPHQLTYGVLFFPGALDQEAQQAKQLRLSLEVGAEKELIVIDLK